MTDDDLLALLDAHLGEVLTPHGFSTAQGGWDGATFFCPAERFTQQFPWLPQATQENWMRSITTDLVVEFDQRTGLLAGVYLEGKTLASTLYGLKHGELSARLKAAMPLPLDESLPVFAEALAAAFTAPDDALSSEPFIDPA